MLQHNSRNYKLAESWENPLWIDYNYLQCATTMVADIELNAMMSPCDRVMVARIPDDGDIIQL